MKRRVKQFLGVLRDVHVVAGNLALFDERAGAPATTVDHLLIGENGLVHGVPVHDLGLAIRDAALQHLQEEPLVPAVIRGVARREFARPVDREAQRVALRLHDANVLVRPCSGSDLSFHRCVFGGQPKRVPPHRHQHVVALHPEGAHQHVVDRVVTYMAHVQLAGRIRQHRAGVVLAFREAWIVFDDRVGVGRRPKGLRSGFNRFVVIRGFHNEPCVQRRWRARLSNT